MNKKLRKIGKDIDVSDDDIKEIEKERLKEKIIFILVSLIITVWIFVLGYRYLDISVKDGGYPYAVSIPLMARKRPSGKLSPIIATILMVLITSTLACFLYMPLYGVYSDKARNNINELICGKKENLR